MYCKNCGTKVQDGETFCSLCGNRMIPEEKPAYSADTNNYNQNNYNQNNNFIPPTMPFTGNKVKQVMKNRVMESIIVLGGFVLMEIIGIMISMQGKGAKIGGFIISLGLIVLLVWVCRYAFFETLRNLQQLERRGMSEIGADINPNVNGEYSAGKYAFFLKKRKLIIPYSDVLWVYKSEEPYTTKNGSGSATHYLIINTRDGKVFKFRAKPEEFMIIFGEHSEAFPKELLIGFTPENERKYKMLIRKGSY